MASIGSGSPTAPSAVAPISRRRSSSASRLDLASVMLWSLVPMSAALGRSSGSRGKAQLSALKSLRRWGSRGGWHENPELGRTAGHPVANRVEQLLSAESMVRHHQVPMHNRFLTRPRGFSRAVSR